MSQAPRSRPRPKRQPTRTARYFLDLFGAATLRGAIDRAIQPLRPRALPGLENHVSGAVDLDPILQKRGILVGPDLAEHDCPEGQLVPSKDGFVVRVRPGPSHRRRFSLAHEIGHTFFYQNDGLGPRHQIGDLSAVEHSAEEQICNRFAASLLLPADPLRSTFQISGDHSPWSLIDRLHATARTFEVSIPAIVARLAEIEMRASPFLLLYLRYVTNRRTGSDPKLRVLRSVSLSRNTDGTFVWSNQSAESVALQSAADLFKRWMGATARQSEGRGCYTTGPEGMITRFSAASRTCASDQIKVTTLRDGRWQQRLVGAEVANSLYRFRQSGKPECDVYVISIARLHGKDDRGSPVT